MRHTRCIPYFCHLFVICFFFFFFQAEDGIRDHCVTGVQTCALPIYAMRAAPADPGTAWRGWRRASWASDGPRRLRATGTRWPDPAVPLRRWPADRAARAGSRSEERRVGKEGRARWVADPHKNKSEYLGVGERWMLYVQ